ncbi:MAG: hypothetical protein JKY41_00700 [Rhodobacteraceae bacterium]|nr:hypothetical protein [Paracoccaceae bacterium]
MTIISDVFKELFKMFVADLRQTLAILGCVSFIAILLQKALVSPLAGGLLLALFCLVILAESVMRETRVRGQS